MFTFIYRFPLPSQFSTSLPVCLPFMFWSRMLHQNNMGSGLGTCLDCSRQDHPLMTGGDNNEIPGNMPYDKSAPSLICSIAVFGNLSLEQLIVWSTFRALLYSIRPTFSLCFDLSVSVPDRSIESVHSLIYSSEQQFTATRSTRVCSLFVRPPLTILRSSNFHSAPHFPKLVPQLSVNVPRSYFIRNVGFFSIVFRLNFNRSPTPLKTSKQFAIILKVRHKF